MWDTIWPYLTAILPTIIVAVIFYFLMKAILQGDHRERLAQSQWEAEQDRAAQQRPTDTIDDDTPSDESNSGNTQIS